MTRMNKFIVEKLLSKKFIGWLGSCIFLWFGKITDDTWLWVTIVYMGAELTTNLMSKIGKCNGKETNESNQS